MDILPLNLLSLRQALEAMLGPNAKYLRIRDDSKAPTGSFKVGKRNRLIHVPKEGNYGILPQGLLLILDVDVHGATSLEEQEIMFSRLLAVELARTFSVNTPSGGRHYYLWLPPSVRASEILPAPNMRGLQAKIQAITGLSCAVDADLRSDAVNAYVLGPGSTLSAGSYSVACGESILPIGATGVGNLTKLREKNEEAKTFTDLWVHDALPAGETMDKLPTPLVKTLERLGATLASRRLLTYHQQRAFVKAAMQCCYSSEAIVAACVFLLLDRDSASGKRLSRYRLRQDLASFTPNRSFHGRYCPQGWHREQHREYTPEQVQSHIEEARQRRIATKTIAPIVYYAGRDCRVIDFTAVGLALLTCAGVQTMKYRNAVSLLENIVAPLTNLGVKNVILARNFVEEELQITATQADQALRLLRKAGVLQLKKRQHQGFASTYEVAPRFIHERLTRQLRRSGVEQRQQQRQRAVIFDSRQGAFIEAVTGNVIFTSSVTQALASKQMETLAINASPMKTTVINRYLRSEWFNC